MNAGAFVDIERAGGRFVDGGYNGSVDFGDTRAWTGSLGTFIPVVVDLPANAAGKSLRFRWRLTTDGSIGAAGWYIDTISVDDGYSCCATPPLRIDSITLESSSVVLQWTSIPGRRYRIQHAPAIDAAQWFDLPDEITAEGSTTTRTASTRASAAGCRCSRPTASSTPAPAGRASGNRSPKKTCSTESRAAATSTVK